MSRGPEETVHDVTRRCTECNSVMALCVGIVCDACQAKEEAIANQIRVTCDMCAWFRGADTMCHKNHKNPFQTMSADGCNDHLPNATARLMDAVEVVADRINDIRDSIMDVVDTLDDE